MAEFFSKYPKLLYGDKVATDIIARVALREKYANKVQLYYEYDLQEGDTPEIVASKYYGDPEKNWIVMFMNEIIDPVFDFPLSQSNFIKYLDAKYATEGADINRSGSEYASITINPEIGYSVDIITTDFDSGITSTNTIYIDETAYNEQYDNDVFNYINEPNSSVQYVKNKITIYDYEEQLNESKRTIKLLQKQYVSQIENELSSLMKLQYN